jgi:hypothetical protein
MVPFLRLWIASAALLLCGLGTAVHAAPVQPNRNATGTVQISAPATVRRLQHMDFAFLSSGTTAGTAIMNPDTDAVTTTGGVTRAGGTPYAAMFEAISPEKNVVIIRLPRQPTNLTRVGGTETMTLSNWTISGGDTRKSVPAKEPFTFKIGGTLYVGANQVEGTYTGTFTIDVQFP